MSQSKKIYTHEDLVENEAIRIPVCLCIDASRSMSFDNGIEKLEQGIKKLYEEIQQDESIKYGLELCIVTFGEKVKVVEPFSLILNRKIPSIKTSGNTLLGTAVNRALDLLEERKILYRQYGIDYFQPWLIIMTDGASYGETKKVLAEAQYRARELERINKLRVFPVAIGKKAKKDALANFSCRPEPVMNAETTKFSNFFAKLAQSISAKKDDNQAVDFKETPLSEVDEWDDFD
jgi:uncharacterized protein YegL